MVCDVLDASIHVSTQLESQFLSVACCEKRLAYQNVYRLPTIKYGEYSKQVSLPQIDDIFYQLQGVSVFSKLYLWLSN